MKLDHTIVPCSNSKECAEFYVDTLGLEHGGKLAHFEVVKIGPDLKLLFDAKINFEPHHYAFQAGMEEYDSILRRIKKRQYPFGNSPSNRVNSKEYEGESEKGFYFDDTDGHVLEVITKIKA